MPFSYARVVEKNAMDAITLREIAKKHMPMYCNANIDEIVDWYHDIHLAGIVKGAIEKAKCT